MSAESTPRFLYLNRDNRWRDFQWVGLDLRPDGALRLRSLPLLQGSLPDGIAGWHAPTAPSGITVGPHGDIYMSDTSDHRLLKFDGCDGSHQAVPCIGGEGDGPGRLRYPRGVLFHPLRRQLFVADSGNHRIEIFDPESYQLADIWGQSDASAVPQPGAEPGQLNTPWSLAADASGNVYAVDYGNQRVQKFDLSGHVIPAFWNAVRDHVALVPADVAVRIAAPAAEVYILDATARTIHVFDPEGRPIRAAIHLDMLQQPMGLAVTATALYVGENRLRRLLQFTPDGTFVGQAWGYEGPNAAIAVGDHGRILLHPGTAIVPIALTATGAYGSSGVLWGGPFSNTSVRREQWHRLQALIEPLAPGAHLQLFFSEAASLQGGGLPPSPPVDAMATQPFADTRWQVVAADAPETLFPGAPLDHVWVGVAFSGDGLASPVLSQMRLDFAHQTYVRYLPAIYQENAASRALLARFLSVFESVFSGMEAQINGLAALFDPAATPPEFLPWLAGWLALALPDAYDEARCRQAIAQAFASYARRGTVEGLRQAVREGAGVEVQVDEPILHTGWWALPPDEAPTALEMEGSTLGFTTVLVVAEPQGAVVGTTALLDESHLIADEEYGMPLFEDVAHQCTVQMYRGRSYSDHTRDEVRAVLDAEKPAHTAYHLCVVEPRMRVGFQARLGIDSVVAGPLAPTLPAPTYAAGPDLVLGGEPAGRIGERSEVGRTTRLGAEVGRY